MVVWPIIRVFSIHLIKEEILFKLFLNDNFDLDILPK